jgi:uncharacterized membrane protein YdjX (TVP38/TMEM64 family)
VVALAAFFVLDLRRYVGLENLRSHLDDFQALVGENLFLAVVLFFLAYLTLVALSVPAASALSLLAGALFGRWLGTALVSIASTSGATLAFLASRYLFRDTVQRRFGNRLRAINRGVQRDGAYYLFMLRLSPVFPFFLINLGMGLTPMRTWTFAGVSLLGMLPGTFLYVNAGTYLGQIDSPHAVLSSGLLISLALLGVVPLGLRLLLRRLGVWGTPAPDGPSGTSHY